MLSLILLVFSFVLALCAAFNWSPRPNIHMGWLSIAFWVASELFGRAGPLLGYH